MRHALTVSAAAVAVMMFAGSAQATTCGEHNAACLKGGSNASWVSIGWSAGKCARSFAICTQSCKDQPASGNWPAWDGSGGMYPATCGPVKATLTR